MAQHKKMRNWRENYIKTKQTPIISRGYFKTGLPRRKLLGMARGIIEQKMTSGLIFNHYTDDKLYSLGWHENYLGGWLKWHEN